MTRDGDLDGFYPVSLSANMSTRKFGLMVVILLCTLAACFPPPFLLCLLKSWERKSTCEKKSEEFTQPLGHSN